MVPFSRYAWLDKRYVLTKNATVPITTHAIHYGTCVFEGVRAYWNDSNLNVFRLDDHIARLRRSGRFYDMSLRVFRRRDYKRSYRNMQKEQAQGVVLHQAVLLYRGVRNQPARD